MRLFIAVPLPLSLATRAATILPETVGGLRRVPSENLHVTLAFLGYTPDERLPDAIAAAEAAAVKVEAFRLVFVRLGRFPERGRPRVFWLGIAEGQDSLLRLGAAVAAELRSRKLRFDDRPLSPHLTLARVPEALSLAEARDAAAVLGELHPPVLTTVVSDIAVMESVLARKGPTYSAKARLPLRPRPRG